MDPLALAHEVLAPYRQENPRKIAIEGVSFGLSPRQARMFGLALHELATNAAKHGAIGVAQGTVRLEWHLVEVNGRHQLSMTWQEVDGPEITPPKRSGFGTRLLEDVVSHELRGEAELLYERRGLHDRLEFPVDEQDDDRRSA